MFNRERFTTGNLVHRLRDEASTDLPARGGPWWAIAATWLWAQRFRGTTIGTSDPAPDIAHRAQRISMHLNSEVGHDGVWVIALYDRQPFEIDQKHAAYSVARALWADADGDVQLVLELDDFLDDAKAIGVEDYTEQAENAWHEYQKMIFGVLAPAPSQIIRRS